MCIRDRAEIVGAEFVGGVTVAIGGVTEDNEEFPPPPHDASIAIEAATKRAECSDFIMYSSCRDDN